jgi:hypothetical protein
VNKEGTRRGSGSGERGRQEERAQHHLSESDASCIRSTVAAGASWDGVANGRERQRRRRWNRARIRKAGKLEGEGMQRMTRRRAVCCIILARSGGENGGGTHRNSAGLGTRSPCQLKLASRFRMLRLSSGNGSCPKAYQKSPIPKPPLHMAHRVIRVQISLDLISN